jgi:hypothetical protein
MICGFETYFESIGLAGLEGCAGSSISTVVKGTEVRYLHLDSQIPSNSLRLHRPEERD